MTMEYENIINDAFDAKDSAPHQIFNIKEIIDEVLEQLDSGDLRVCEKINDQWVVHQWVKKAILLSFRTNNNFTLSGPYATWFDNV